MYQNQSKAIISRTQGIKIPPTYYLPRYSVPASQLDIPKALKREAAVKQVSKVVVIPPTPTPTPTESTSRYIHNSAHHQPPSHPIPKISPPKRTLFGAWGGGEGGSDDQHNMDRDMDMDIVSWVIESIVRLYLTHPSKVWMGV
ncbi:hypothetical protein BO71DRAFT_439606 [Aspergillus ellipticus CBS 707.79]|uniref:Uncharacterized protein n=1 Tax=Aspergillus ellipticus CBS 707.79 TaxID=1448320 RepID=A0A319DFZ0_9EURO|nr:hypothetical protein BO71DRAFT_439606 [Aspergillus ellipticus CBS 707.79]